MTNVKKILDLSGAERRTLVVALFCLPMVYLRIRLFGFEKTIARLQRDPLPQFHDKVDPAIYPAQTSRLVNAVARFLFHREACLERSIMLWSLLRCKGIESELKIGVAAENSGLQAHAWVEINGEAINENSQLNERFTAFSSSITANFKDNL